MATLIRVGDRLCAASQAAVITFGWPLLIDEMSTTGPGTIMRRASRNGRSTIDPISAMPPALAPHLLIDCDRLLGCPPPVELRGAHQAARAERPGTIWISQY